MLLRENTKDGSKRMHPLLVLDLHHCSYKRFLIHGTPLSLYYNVCCMYVLLKSQMVKDLMEEHKHLFYCEIEVSKDNSFRIPAHPTGKATWTPHLPGSRADPALHGACATHSRAPLSWRWRAEATGVNQEENAAQLAQLTTSESAEVAGGHREDVSPSSTFPEAGGGAIPPPVCEFSPLPGALPVKCLDSVATSTAVRR